MVSQPLRYHNSSPTFLSGGSYSVDPANSHHSLSDSNLSSDLMEEERKLWAAEKKLFQQQIQVADSYYIRWFMPQNDMYCSQGLMC